MLNDFWLSYFTIYVNHILNIEIFISTLSFLQKSHFQKIFKSTSKEVSPVIIDLHCQHI